MLRELPDGWKMINLEDHIQIFGRIGWRGLKRGEYTKEGPLFLAVKDINEFGDIDFRKVKDHLSDFRYDESPEIQLQNDDILITKDGTIGKVGFVKNLPQKTTVNSSILVVRPGSILIPRFLFYYFRGESFQKIVKDRISGSSIPHLFQKDIKKFQILVPPLSIQRQIVAVLEQAEAVKRQRQEADALTGALLQSVFYEMFGDPVRNERGWPLKNIKEFSTTGKNAIKAGPFGSSLKKDCYTKNGFKIYGQEQVIKDDLQFGDYYISEEKYQELINYSVQAGDILISLVGSYGKISIVPESFEQGIINPRLMKISLNQEIVLPIFFKQLFLTEAILNQIEELSHGGTMDIINVGIIKQLKFPVPPLPLQQQFARVVEEVERIRERQVASGKEIEGLCAGLMSLTIGGKTKMRR